MYIYIHTLLNNLKTFRFWEKQGMHWLLRDDFLNVNYCFSSVFQNVKNVMKTSKNDLLNTLTTSNLVPETTHDVNDLNLYPKLYLYCVQAQKINTYHWKETHSSFHSELNSQLRIIFLVKMYFIFIFLDVFN